MSFPLETTSWATPLADGTYASLYTVFIQRRGEHSTGERQTRRENLHSIHSSREAANTKAKAYLEGKVKEAEDFSLELFDDSSDCGLYSGTLKINTTPCRKNLPGCTTCAKIWDIEVVQVDAGEYVEIVKNKEAEREARERQCDEALQTEEHYCGKLDDLQGTENRLEVVQETLGTVGEMWDVKEETIPEVFGTTISPALKPGVGDEQRPNEYATPPSSQSSQLCEATLQDPKAMNTAPPKRPRGRPRKIAGTLKSERSAAGSQGPRRSNRIPAPRKSGH